MVIEHSFVTTMEGERALVRASGFLAQHGFVPARQHAFPMPGSQMASLEMSRGKKNPSRARSIAELPQAIRVDFDRGRITVAASITPSHVWGGSQWTSIGAPRERADRMAVHQNLMLGIVNGLERLLVHGDSDQQASLTWRNVEAHIEKLARQRKRRVFIALGVVFGLLFLVILLIIFA